MLMEVRGTEGSKDEKKLQIRVRKIWDLKESTCGRDLYGRGGKYKNVEKVRTGYDNIKEIQL